MCTGTTSNESSQLQVEFPDSSVYKMHQFGAAARGKAPFFAGLKKSEGSRGDHMFNFCLAGCIVICWKDFLC